MTRPARIAIVGAAGLVGETLLRVLEQRGYAPTALALFGGERSAGSALSAFGQQWPVRALGARARCSGAALISAADLDPSLRRRARRGVLMVCATTCGVRASRR